MGDRPPPPRRYPDPPFLRLPHLPGILGPDQTHVGARAANRIPGYTAEQYIRESIVEPCAYNVTPADDGIEADYDCNLMEATLKSILLSDAEIDALVAFLLAQK